MLVLTRREGERLVIANGEVVITVLRIDHLSRLVRLAIYAPGLPIETNPKVDIPDGASFASQMLYSIKTPEEIPRKLKDEFSYLWHVNDRIRIGSNIVLTIVKCRQENVRLGIDAPREIQVHREEVYDAIRLNPHA